MNYCANCNKVIYGNRDFCDEQCEREYDRFIDAICFPYETPHGDYVKMLEESIKNMVDK